MPESTILIIEDESRMRSLIDLVLRSEGYRLILAESGEAGLRFADEGGIDLVLTDWQMGEVSGLDVLEHITKESPGVPVVIITGFGTVKSAVEATKKGAFDYISKPIDNDELKIVVKRALDMRRLTLENLGLSQGLREQFGFDKIIGASPKLSSVKALARDIAVTDSTVLIAGESGTGKELLARAIHYASPRAGGPLISINCAAIPEHLLESELFGYEKGAFTDAKKAKPGRFLLAHRGTLFLDEIGEMSTATQVKLLRVLEDRMIEPLGGVRGIKVDLRLVAATNQDLQDLVKRGKFREDLFYRLSVCPLHLPPLRERTGDMPILLEHFLARYNRERGTRIAGLTPQALRLVEMYAWPGNVREFQNMVEWVTITCKGTSVNVDNLPAYLKITKPDSDPDTKPSVPSLLSYGLSVEEVEKVMLEEALARAKGNVSEAARLLKITRNTLRYRMGKYHLKVSSDAE
ncbi:MAG: sigma-54-dependent Fis family transcriptional regulator [Nitrospirae bacterium]|nr:MAG: sigma-54-dependent Fis family transcriptional regulator [Nitrospirota bacterium]